MVRFHGRAYIVATAVLMSALVAASSSHCAPIEQVVVASKVVARIASPGEYGSLLQRVAKIDQRVTQAISVEDVGSPRMSVRGVGGMPAVFIGNTMLMKAYPGDAQKHNCSADRLARQWAESFRQQFPLAEPVIHMDNPMSGSELARAKARTAASASVKVKQQDWAIVAVVLDYMARARVMADPVFERELPTLAGHIYRDVCQQGRNAQMGIAGPIPPHYPGKCPEAGGCPACRAAKKAAVAVATRGRSGLRQTSTPAAETVVVPRETLRRNVGGLKLMRGFDL